MPGTDISSSFVAVFRLIFPDATDSVVEEANVVAVVLPTADSSFDDVTVVVVVDVDAVVFGTYSMRVVWN